MWDDPYDLVVKITPKLLFYDTKAYKISLRYKSITWGFVIKRFGFIIVLLLHIYKHFYNFFWVIVCFNFLKQRYHNVWLKSKYLLELKFINETLSVICYNKKVYSIHKHHVKFYFQLLLKFFICLCSVSLTIYLYIMRKSVIEYF